MDRHATVVVGAGQAGGWAALTLARLDPARAVTLVGAEALPPYERPPLSKEVLRGEALPGAAIIAPRAEYERAGIDLRLGVRVDAIDRLARRLHLGDGTSLPWDTLVLATGSRARRLGVPGGDDPGLVHLRDAADALALRDRLRAGGRIAIVGAGLIGLEVASAASALGLEVTVVEAGRQAMGRLLDPAIAARIVARHAARGVRFRWTAPVEAVERAGAAYRLFIAGQEPVEAETVLVAIGAVPETSLAEAAGLEVDDGLVVDAWGRSSDPAIRGAGDVTRHWNPLLGRHIRLESWQNAQNQAIAVARAMAGEEKPYAEVPWCWTDQQGMNVQIAGAPRRWDRLVMRGEGDGPLVAVQLDDGVVVGGCTLDAGREMRHVRRLVASRGRIVPERLADSRVPLASLAAEAEAQPLTAS